MRSSVHADAVRRVHVLTLTGWLDFDQQRWVGSDRNRDVIEPIQAETFTQARRQVQAAGPAWVLGPEDRRNIDWMASTRNSSSRIAAFSESFQKQVHPRRGKATR